MMWQPIDTVPRGRERLILLIEPVYMVIGVWSAEHDAWCAAWDYTPLRETPTHWMPLPEPPPEDE